MSIYEHTLGNPYCTDEQYNEFLGKPYTGVIFDWTRRCWVRCVMQAPKTPRDAVTPVDADEQLSSDPWVDDVAYTCDRKPHPATVALMERVVDLLRGNAMTQQQIADATGDPLHRIKSLFRDHGGAFVVVARRREGGKVYTYNAGVHDEHA